MDQGRGRWRCHEEASDEWRATASYRPALLTPVQLLPHDLDDAWKGFVCRLHVQEAQASPARDDVNGRAGVLLDGVQHLRRRRGGSEGKRGVGTWGAAPTSASM